MQGKYYVEFLHEAINQCNDNSKSAEDDSKTEPAESRETWYCEESADKYCRSK